MNNKEFTYSKNFYNHNIQTNDKSAEVIVSFIENLYNPTSVVDIGASGGLFLTKFMKYDVKDILGVDGPWVSDENIMVPKEKFKRLDFTKPFSIGRKFDLAICLEVLEHLNENAAKSVLKELTLLSDIVLFSAAAPGQGGTHHTNEQWPSYWAKEFKKYGFKYIDLRQYIWNENDILPWYRQNMMIYLRDTHYNDFLNKLNGFKSENPLPVIHPDMTYLSLLSIEKNSLFLRFLVYVGTLLTRVARTYAILKKSEKPTP